jgi:phage terminase large subunit GpA-like protein
MGSLRDLPQLPDSPSAADVYWRAFCGAIRPDLEITISEWADRNRKLTGKGGPEPGQWRTARVPFMREIMNCLSPSHPCTEVTLCKGTQIGGTEVGYNWIGAVIDQWPGPMMLVPMRARAIRATRC